MTKSQDLLTNSLAICSAEELAPGAIAGWHSVLFAVHINSAMFSLSLRMSLALQELFVQR